MNTFSLAVFLMVVASISAGHLGYGWLGHNVAPVAHVAPLNSAAHIPSGSVSVSHDGVLIAGPAGSIHTDNGLHGHGAGVNVAGPSGDIHTKEGRVVLTGPGSEHDDGHDNGYDGNDDEYDGHDNGYDGNDEFDGHDDEFDGYDEGYNGHGDAVVNIAPVVAAPVEIASIEIASIEVAPVAVAPVAVGPVEIAPLAHEGYVAGPIGHVSFVGPSTHATIVGPSAHAAVLAPDVAHGVVYAAAPVASWGHQGGFPQGVLGHGYHGW